jgi:hypothetical protein
MKSRILYLFEYETQVLNVFKHENSRFYINSFEYKTQVLNSFQY